MDLFGKKAEKENQRLKELLDYTHNNLDEVKRNLNNATTENQQLKESLNNTFNDLDEVKRNLNNIEHEKQALQKQLDSLQRKLEETGYPEYSKIQDEIRKGKELIAENDRIIASLITDKDKLSSKINSTDKKLKSATNKLSKLREVYERVDYTINKYFVLSPLLEPYHLSESDSNALDELAPSITLKLHAMDMRDLRKAFRNNDKHISKLLEQYSRRYTTKANQSIYQLMVIALRSELQNVLYNMKYEKLDDAVNQIKTITSKYLVIAGEGNQSIAGTLTRFIGEIEYLFINAVKIEYNYYVKKEQARQEQLAIREHIRQEAAERKALEAEKKKIDAEETKYRTEIEKIKAALQSTNNSETATLNRRILELESLLSDVIVKKEDIVNLQNGKAGNIYIISNLGSFGENVFKIGMTRRLNPQDRVNELGDASVPFKFDVHSFIFSEDAVSLEAKLHAALDEKRVNKVNRRKEFFRVTIDELESLVAEIEPTAEFNRMMLAEDYRQSESSSKVYNTDYQLDDDE